MRVERTLITSLAVLCLSTAAGTARAEEQKKDGPPNQEMPKYYAPENGMIELGAFGGVLFPSSNHELYDYQKSQWREINSIAPDFGLRLAYFPLKYLGLEGEGAVMPTGTKDDSAVTLYGLRAHLIGQLPSRFTPFLLAGYGTMIVRSDQTVLGDDGDGGFHWGLGAKYYATPTVMVRADFRHMITAGHDEPGTENGALTSHFELLAGVSLVFNRPNHPPPPDSDKDGWWDENDKCPNEAGVAPDGCPPPDGDKDGVPDKDDKCPTVAGLKPDGCPPPDSDNDGVPDDKDNCPKVAGEKDTGCPPPDSDGDGIIDRNDKCPTENGQGRADGCPPRDSDNDGVIDENDKCPDKPETKNGYQDDDGCPDELPKAVAKFTGVIKGINFDTGSSKIQKASYKLLDDAVKVLKDFPELKMEISGHTDNAGKPEDNLKLSQERADAVKKYFTDKGIDEKRLTAKGMGETAPIADNKKPAGRAQNRRIEFKLVQ